MFERFGVSHLLILASIPTFAAAVAFLVRGRTRATGRAAIALGLALALNELVWYAMKLLHYEGNRFPEGLPFQLCDVTLWLTVVAAIGRVQSAFELAYFAGLGGATMALATPDLWAPWPSYPTIYFFVAHGLIVTTLLALLWMGWMKPRPGCLRRSMILLNVYAVSLMLFNAAFGTNYMYLCRKPQSASLLDYMGPWPVYIVVGELVTLAIFWLLWLPVRRGNAGQVSRAASGVSWK